MKLIDNKTIGNFKSNSSIGEVDIFIRFGYIKVSNKIDKWYFNITDKVEFCEQDDCILLATDKVNLKGIVIYKPLEKVEINPNEIINFEDWKQVRKFDPKIKYDKPKGQRINRYFHGMRCENKDGETYWHYQEEDKWCTDKEDIGQYNGMCGNYNNNIHTFKTAIRKIKQYSKYLPKGTIFKLSNKYVGYDVEITI